MSGPNDIGIAADRVDALACSKCGQHVDLRAHAPFSEVECPACGTLQRVPLRLGNFYLLEELGRGGMGAVYKALDQSLGRYVGLKVMRSELGEDAKALDNFIHEAKAAAALNHPNIVQIYSCGQEQGQPYIVMEMVGGGRLDELMLSEEKLDEVLIMQVGVEVTKGLAAAHDIGLVHGDIKPANILFGSRGEAKVVDFGLARFVASQQAPGEIWGTPFYIAPEKVRKQPEDHRSDIYSLGATLFHCLSGVPPFDGKTAKDVVLARLKAKAPDIRSLRKDLHPETASLLARMLEEDPGRRYPTYKSLLPDIEGALKAAQAGPVKVEPPRKKKSKALLLVAALFLAALAAGVVFALTRGGGGGEELPARKPSYYKLVNGKPVPVYEDEEPVSTPVRKVAPGPKVETPEPEPPSRVEPVYTGQLEKQLRAVFTSLAAGKADPGGKTLTDALNALPETGEGRLWIPLFQCVVAWVEGDEAGYASSAGALVALDPAGSDAAASAAALGRYLKGDLDTAALVKEEVAWTKGAKALRTFLVGLIKINEGDYEKAMNQLNAYAGAKPAEDLGWAYVAQPIAKALSLQVEEWVALSKRVGKPDGGEKTGKLVAELTSFSATAAAPLRVLSDAQLKEAEAGAAEIAEQRVAASAAHQEQVQADLDGIDKARGDVAHFVAGFDFEAASKAFDAASSSSLTTDEGRAWHDAVTDGYRRMAELKAYLIEQLEKNPLGEKARRPLGASAIGATDEGIRVKFQSGAESTKSWRTIGARNFLWITDHYAEGLKGSARAERLLAAALFCYEAGAMDPAQTFAKKAVAADGSVQSVIDLNMPGLVD